MGRSVKGSAALRAKKRGKELLDRIQEQQAEKAFASGKKDEELFVLDTKGTPTPATAAKHVVPARLRAKKTTGLSQLDKLKVDQLLKKHSPDTLVELAKKGASTSSRNKKRNAERTPKFDLWNDIDQPEEKNDTVSVKVGSALAGLAPQHIGEFKRSRSRSDKKLKTQHATGTTSEAKNKALLPIAVDVAQPGQSYHPDPTQHSQVIQIAVTVEVRREQAIRKTKAPLSTGLTPETRALLVDDSSDEENDNGESSNDNGAAASEPTESSTTAGLTKRKQKLTRAQRNKQKRLRQEHRILEQNKKQKKFLNNFSELPRIKKELTKKELQLQIKKEKLQEHSKDTRNPGKNVDQALSETAPISAPTLPVALSSELSSSLRRLKPKGNLVTDRITSFIDRNLAAKASGKKRPKKRRLSVKGRRNHEGVGPNFIVKG